MNKLIGKHIRELCQERRLSPGEFHTRVWNAIEDDGIQKADYPDIATTDRWYNAKTNPEKKWHPYIAKALGVSEDEITLGKKPREEALKEEVQRLGDLLKLNEAEKKKLSSLLIMDGYYLRLFAAFLVSAGTILLNATLWQYGLVYLIPLVLFTAALIFDGRRQRKIDGKRISLLEKTKSNIEFLKTLLKKDLVSRLALNLFLVMILIIFLPSIESIFYRGKFFVSCTVYFVTAVILLIKSIDR